MEITDGSLLELRVCGKKYPLLFFLPSPPLPLQHQKHFPWREMTPMRRVLECMF